MEVIAMNMSEQSIYRFDDPPKDPFEPGLPGEDIDPDDLPDMDDINDPFGSDNPFGQWPKFKQIQ
jgi:hypothetical protein